jgi:hypothetical protein
MMIVYQGNPCGWQRRAAQNDSTALVRRRPSSSHSDGECSVRTRISKTNGFTGERSAVSQGTTLSSGVPSTRLPLTVRRIAYCDSPKTDADGESGVTFTIVISESGRLSPVL